MDEREQPKPWGRRKMEPASGKSAPAKTSRESKPKNVSKAELLQSIRLSDGAFAGGLMSKYGWGARNLRSRTAIVYRDATTNKIRPPSSSVHVDLHVRNIQPLLRFYAQVKAFVESPSVRPKPQVVAGPQRSPASALAGRVSQSGSRSKDSKPSRSDRSEASIPQTRLSADKPLQKAAALEVRRTFEAWKQSITSLNTIGAIRRELTRLPERTASLSSFRTVERSRSASLRRRAGEEARQIGETPVPSSDRSDRVQPTSGDLEVHRRERSSRMDTVERSEWLRRSESTVRKETLQEKVDVRRKEQTERAGNETAAGGSRPVFKAASPAFSWESPRSWQDIVEKVSRMVTLNAIEPAAMPASTARIVQSRPPLSGTGMAFAAIEHTAAAPRLSLAVLHRQVKAERLIQRSAAKRGSPAPEASAVQSPIRVSAQTAKEIVAGLIRTSERVTERTTARYTEPASERRQERTVNDDVLVRRSISDRDEWTAQRTKAKVVLPADPARPPMDQAVGLTVRDAMRRHGRLLHRRDDVPEQRNRPSSRKSQPSAADEPLQVIQTLKLSVRKLAARETLISAGKQSLRIVTAKLPTPRMIQPGQTRPEQTQEKQNQQAMNNQAPEAGRNSASYRARPFLVQRKPAAEKHPRTPFAAAQEQDQTGVKQGAGSSSAAVRALPLVQRETTIERRTLADRVGAAAFRLPRLVSPQKQPMLPQRSHTLTNRIRQRRPETDAAPVQPVRSASVRAERSTEPAAAATSGSLQTHIRTNSTNAPLVQARLHRSDARIPERRLGQPFPRLVKHSGDTKTTMTNRKPVPVKSAAAATAVSAVSAVQRSVAGTRSGSNVFSKASAPSVAASLQIGKRTIVYGSMVHRLDGSEGSAAQAWSTLGARRVAASIGQSAAEAAAAMMPVQRQVSDIVLNVASKAVSAKSTDDTAVKSLEHAVKAVEKELNQAKELWSKPNVDMRKLSDQLYREVTRRLRFEQQRRGL